MSQRTASARVGKRVVVPKIVQSLKKRRIYDEIQNRFCFHPAFQYKHTIDIDKSFKYDDPANRTACLQRGSVAEGVRKRESRSTVTLPQHPRHIIPQKLGPRTPLCSVKAGYERPVRAIDSIRAWIGPGIWNRPSV